MEGDMVVRKYEGYAGHYWRDEVGYDGRDGV